MLTDFSPLNGARKLTDALESAVLALCLYPEDQAIAQDEIDSVVGNSRSPSWEDFDEGRFPYVSALAKEILRWQPVVALACASPTTRDSMFREFWIPKGTKIVCNIWAIHCSSREFPNTNVLRPGRFLRNTEVHCSDGEKNHAFGCGLQHCSGQALAEQSLPSVLARLLWAFSIEPGLNELVSVRDSLSFPKITQMTVWRLVRL